jgi:hypothetical protein
MATELLGAKGLALLRWSSRRMLCMPEEEVRDGITMGSIEAWMDWMGSTKQRREEERRGRESRGGGDCARRI